MPSFIGYTSSRIAVMTPPFLSRSLKSLFDVSIKLFLHGYIKIKSISEMAHMPLTKWNHIKAELVEMWRIVVVAERSNQLTVMKGGRCDIPGFERH